MILFTYLPNVVFYMNLFCTYTFLYRLFLYYFYESPFWGPFYIRLGLIDMAEIEHKGVLRLGGNYSYQHREQPDKKNRSQVGKPALYRTTSFGHKNKGNLQNNRKSGRSFSENRAKTDINNYLNVRTPGKLDLNVKQDKNRSVLYLKGGGEILTNKTVEKTDYKKKESIVEKDLKILRNESNEKERASNLKGGTRKFKVGETTKSNPHGEIKSRRGEGMLENLERLDQQRSGIRQSEQKQKMETLNPQQHEKGLQSKERIVSSITKKDKPIQLDRTGPPTNLDQKNSNKPTSSIFAFNKSKSRNKKSTDGGYGINFKDVKMAKNEVDLKVTLSNPFIKCTTVSQLPKLPNDAHIWKESAKEDSSIILENMMLDASSSDMEIDDDHCLQDNEMVHDKIIGTKIYTKTHVHSDKSPMQYSSLQYWNKNLIKSPKEESNDITNKKKDVCTATFTKKSGTTSDKVAGDAVFRYCLSDRSFIDKGITVLPVVKVIRKTNIYRMIPVNLEFDWMKHTPNKEDGFMQYNSGEKLAEFDANGRGRWYYKNGKLALDYYNAKETNAQQRIVIYSSGQPDEKGRSHPTSILAVFDYLGNGIVFDHVGKIRLKYNQSEGVVLDRSIGPVSKWMWHSCIDRPVLRQVMMDTNLVDKDPEISNIHDSFEPRKRNPQNDEKMLAIELENTAKKQLLNKSHSYQTYQIQMKVLKINKYFSLRIQDQTKIYIIFRDGVNHLKLNIGMILDHNEILDYETSTDSDEVVTNFEKHPPRSTSLEKLQLNLELTKEMDRARVNHELRLRPAVPVASIDRLAAATSRRPPHGPPLPHETAFNATPHNPYHNRKLTRNSLYYDTRIL